MYTHIAWGNEKNSDSTLLDSNASVPINCFIRGQMALGPEKPLKTHSKHFYMSRFNQIAVSYHIS